MTKSGFLVQCICIVGTNLSDFGLLLNSYVSKKLKTFQSNISEQIQTIGYFLVKQIILTLKFS